MIGRIGRTVRRHFPPSIRAVLTLFYTAIFAFLLAIILIVSYAFIRISTAVQTQGVLIQTANAMAQRLAFHGGQICLYPATTLPGGNGALPTCDGQPDGPPKLQLVIPGNVALRLQDIRGSVLYQSPTFARLIVPATITSTALEGVIKEDTVPVRTGGAADLLTVPVQESAQHLIFGVLQIARTPAERVQSDNGLGVILLLSYPVLVVLGGFGSYVLATRAFRPIKRLTQAARQIAGGDLQQRVPVPLAHDDIHTLAQTFNEMTARLERAFAHQRRFVADASHELRTPVAVIRSMTDVALVGEPTRAEALATLREVNAEAERLSRLINTLLGLARADDGRLPMDREVVQLDLLVADVVESVTPLAQERGLRLAARRLDAAQVVGDTAQLIQIIMCLVDNALNYTPADGLINLAVIVADGTAQVAVSDTGMGIAPADLPHIFERFYRADAARSRATGGNGLGLALALEFARALGGTITVLSQVGQGSTFTLTLPLAAQG